MGLVDRVLLLTLVAFKVYDEPFDFLFSSELLILVLLVDNSLDALKVLVSELFLFYLSLFFRVLRLSQELGFDTVGLPHLKFADVVPHLFEFVNLVTVN